MALSCGMINVRTFICTSGTAQGGLSLGRPSFRSSPPLHTQLLLLGSHSKYLDFTCGLAADLLASLTLGFTVAFCTGWWACKLISGPLLMPYSSVWPIGWQGVFSKLTSLLPSNITTPFLVLLLGRRCFSLPYMSLVYSSIKSQHDCLHIVLQSCMSLLSIHRARNPGFLPVPSRLGYCPSLWAPHLRSGSSVLDYVMHLFAFLPFLFCISYIPLLFPFTRKKKPFHILPIAYL